MITKSLSTPLSILRTGLSVQSSRVNEFIRYVLNGLLATGVHFSLLVLKIELLKMESAGVANLFASTGGIAASFLGNRYFVFKQLQEGIFEQAIRFSALYGTIALLHGSILYGWSDIYGFKYQTGFLIATLFQFMASYLGNRILVFRT